MQECRGPCLAIPGTEEASCPSCFLPAATVLCITTYPFSKSRSLCCIASLDGCSRFVRHSHRPHVCWPRELTWAHTTYRRQSPAIVLSISSPLSSTALVNTTTTASGCKRIETRSAVTYTRTADGCCLRHWCWRRKGNIDVRGTHHRSTRE
jgi:hypothetical protein